MMFFILGILTVIVNNPLPHLIIELPDTNTTYIDNDNIKYKYKLTLLNHDESKNLDKRK